MQETQTQQSYTASAIQSKIDGLCKPIGSLGKLESLAKKLCESQHTLQPQTRPCFVTIFAADHGINQCSVSAWPSEVTGQVTRVMTQKKTASGVFAESLGCQYEVVDVGLLQPLMVRSEFFIEERIEAGTRNFRDQASMTEEQFDRAWSVGACRARYAIDGGAKILIGGEMGIGNTTSATCLICLLCGIDSDAMVGPGAGIDAPGLHRKREVIRFALQRVQGLGGISAKAIGCEVGGFELVALAGFYTEASRHNVTILIDGLIASSAALLAYSLRPSDDRERFCQQLIAAHLSTEPAHTTALQKMGLEPVLDLGMRLGEATGALALVPVLDLAKTMLIDMATLSSIG